MDNDIDRVRKIVATAGELDDIGPNEDLYAAGIDSIQALEIMVDLEAEFGVAVADEQFVKARTAADLLALVVGLRSGAA